MDAIEEAKIIKDAITVSPEALQEEFIRLPGDIAHWSGRYAQAVRLFLIAEAARREAEARAWLECKAAGIASAGEKGKAPTVDDLKAMVATRPEVLACVVEEIETAAEKERVRGIYEAVRTKKDAIVSIGATQRAELDGNPSLRQDARMRDREAAAGRAFGGEDRG